MSSETGARRTSIEVEFDGAGITKRIRPYLLGLTYTDCEEGQADDLQLRLQDRGGLWRESWLASMLEGAVKSRPLKIQAAIVLQNWTGGGRDQRLDCGSFELDAADLSAPPSALLVKATALPFSGQIRQTKKSRAWENYRLSGIAREMAKAAGLGCMYEAQADPKFDRQEQRKQSDIDFLSRLCRDAGLSLKATDGMLVVFDQAVYEKRPPVKTIQPGREYLSARLSAGTAGTKYASCRVRYQGMEGVAYADDYDPEAKNNQQLEVTARVSSQGEAQALAANRLRMHNKFSKTASFTFPGDPVLLAGNTVQLAGWGVFDGKYMISQAVHTVDGGGYVTKINLRRCLEG